MSPAVEVAVGLYERWNADGLSGLVDSVDPAIELITDPLRPVETALRGVAGWQRWAARWEERFDAVHVTVDGLLPIDAEHVLALVSITATPTGATSSLRWAAAHLWTLRDGRIARWETHVDLGAACRTLDD